MAKFDVVVQEEHHMQIEADSEAQVRQWFDEGGPGHLQDRFGSLEIHDRILSIRES